MSLSTQQQNPEPGRETTGKHSGQGYTTTPKQKQVDKRHATNNDTISIKHFQVCSCESENKQACLEFCAESRPSTWVRWKIPRREIKCFMMYQKSDFIEEFRQ